LPTPLELTQQLLDISVTERGQFRTCRRRWWYSVIENLQPRLSDDFALQFGTGIHDALEAFYRSRSSRPRRVEASIEAFEAWSKREKEAAIDNDAFERVLEYEELGHHMLLGYFNYDKVAPVQLGKPLAVEGIALPGSQLKPKLPAGYPKAAAVVRHESGRLLVPVVDPDTKQPLNDPDLNRPVFLSMRLDLITQRESPKKGIWITDHKTASSAPSDKGIDYDDQITGYCYGTWRWLGQIPRGVVYNSLIKQIPKEPRMVQGKRKDEGLVLSTAKDQLTTPDLYQAALIEQGLMKRGRILSEEHALCMGALLARGWDPFFRRYEVMRNAHELESFEHHLVNEYRDMVEAYDDPAKRYPNRSTWTCPRCPVNKICLAIEDGSDAEFVIDHQFVVGPDRKAAER
jgi:hypothetical protein